MAALFLQTVLVIGAAVALAAVVIRARRQRDKVPRVPAGSVGPLIREPRDHVETPPAPSSNAAIAPPSEASPFDPLHDDVNKLVRYMSFCCGKGVSFDDISADTLRLYARATSPQLLDCFFHHLAANRPDLWEERARFAEDLPGDIVLYRIKSYSAFLNEKELLAECRWMRSAKSGGNQGSPIGHELS